MTFALALKAFQLGFTGFAGLALYLSWDLLKKASPPIDRGWAALVTRYMWLALCSIILALVSIGIGPYFTGKVASELDKCTTDLEIANRDLVSNRDGLPKVITKANLIANAWHWHFAEGNWVSTLTFTKQPDGKLRFSGTTLLKRTGWDGVLTQTWEAKDIDIPDEGTDLLQFQGTRTIKADLSTGEALPTPQVYATLFKFRPGKSIRGSYQAADGSGQLGNMIGYLPPN